MPVSVRAKVAPPIVVRRSRIQGRGVFATRSIAAGERIVEYLGARLTHEEADAECPDDEASVRHHTFLFAVDDHMIGRYRGQLETIAAARAHKPDAHATPPA